MRSTIAAIRERGCSVKARDGKIIVLPSPDGELTDDVLCLVERLRRGKEAALLALCEQENVLPCEGDPCSIAFEGEADMRRWALAVREGLIHLTGPVRVNPRSGRCRISFRCNQPMEWLHDAITAQCKREYNKVLERIHAGEAWLGGCEGSPEQARAYDGFLKLWEDLRVLAEAAGELPGDPLKGYEGAGR